MKPSKWGSLVSFGIGAGFLLQASSFWAAPYGPGITVGQESFSALFGWIGGALICVSGIFLFMGQSRRVIFASARLIIPIVPFGILTAVGTGWWTIGGGVNPGGISAANYGFPFTWKIVQTSCPPPCVQANTTVYNPAFLALDSAFFVVLFYWVATIVRRKWSAKSMPVESAALPRVRIVREMRSLSSNPNPDYF